MTQQSKIAFEQEILNAIVKISSEAVWVNDYVHDEQYWLASPANIKRFLLPTERKNPDYWTTNIHPADYLQAVKGFQGAMEDKSVTFFEHEYRFMGDGVYHLIHDRMEFYRDEHGKPYLVVGVWTDITEKRASEKRLRELITNLRAEHEQAQILSKLTNTVLWKLDYSDRIIHWTAGNDNIERYGLSEEGYHQSFWINAIHPEDRERVTAHMTSVIKSNSTTYSDEYRFVHSGGKIAHLVVRGYIIRNADGAAVQILGGWTDITSNVEREQTLKEALKEQRKLNIALKEREEELASSEEELRQLNDHLRESLHTLEERELQLVASHQKTQEAYKKMEELRLMALRSVMNPHFVFNALNSIQFFIAKNKREDAINYLSTFSKLIRGVLNASVKNHVLLYEEILMLEYYIQLEQVRFENVFVYEIDVDPELERDIEIPSLLIQPFVENAILHGLYNKKEKGKLTIKFREEGERLLISITDDGIGREAAARLKGNDEKKHQSMGSNMTEERLKLINNQNHVNLEIIDHHNSEGLGTGTTVNIWLDLNV